MARSVADLYYKKTVDLRFVSARLKFDIPESAFSSFQIDRGTRNLLREIERRATRFDRVLDLGCGYGPIACSLVKSGLAHAADGVDRDALAVAYAERNAARNHIQRAVFRGGLAYDHAERDTYDAVLSNVPAKAGIEVHRMMLLGAGACLREGGEVWVVVVEPLAASVERILERGPAELIERRPHGEHVVYGYTLPAETPLPEDPFLRAEGEFAWKTKRYRMRLVWGLPEFDTLNWGTEILLAVAMQQAERLRPKVVACGNPGQGHVPVLLHRACDRIRRFELISRDLLSLRTAEANLRGNGFSGEITNGHAIGFLDETHPSSAALRVVQLNERESVDINGEKLLRLRTDRPGEAVVVGCSTSYASRIEQTLSRRGHRPSTRKKRRGFAALVLPARGG